MIQHHGSMNALLLVAALGSVLAGSLLVNPSANGDTRPVPSDLRDGEAKFKAHCARCHGEQAVGTTHGPPLVHKIYEPTHHGDAAFQRAAAQGVRAHHWSFGDMPKIEGVTAEEVGRIIAYVRWLQRQAGIQ